MSSLQKPRALIETVTRTSTLCSTRHYHQLPLFARSRPRYSPRRAIDSFPRSARIRHVSYEQQAKDLNQKGVDKQLDDHDAKIAGEDQEKQRQAPWHREGSDKPPVHTQRQASAMTKGKFPYVFVCPYTYSRDKENY